MKGENLSQRSSSVNISVNTIKLGPFKQYNYSSVWDGRVHISRTELQLRE